MSQEQAPEQAPQPFAPKMSFLEAIKVRSSIRNYARVPTAEEIEYIEGVIKSLPKSGPFPESEARFVYIPAELGFMSSYGVIGGPHHFLCGAVKAGGHDLETYGYLFERLQLECFRIGLGTVWLGGTFTTGPFAPYIDIKDPAAEIMPAVAPVGLSTGSVGFVAGLLKWTAGSTSRKEWSEMFFDGKYGNGITKEAAGQYAECLEAVRKAPSAINKQPWIIVRDEKGAWHFYCRLIRPLSRADIGIAMCHWELACNELGLNGSWKVLEEPPTEQLSVPKDCPYIATWVPAGSEGN